MKIKKNLSLLLSFACIIFLMTSCQKFAEGGRVSKAESNLKVSWKLEKYLRNGTDETANLLVQNYEETYTNNYDFIRSYVKNNEIISETGKWHLNKGEEKLQISGVGSIDLTTASGTVSASYFNIIKLDRNDFWYNFTNGSDKHEFHLVKK